MNISNLDLLSLFGNFVFILNFPVNKPDDKALDNFAKGISAALGIRNFVRKKGDPDAGVIFVKIDLLDNNVVLLRRDLNYVIEKNILFI